MYTKSRWVAGLFAAVLAVTLMAARASAQGTSGYFQTDPEPYPPFSRNLNDGGIFIAGEYVMYRQTNPIKSQVLGLRGFTVTLPNAVPDPTGTFPLAVGTFVGNQSVALNTNDLTGEEFAPGYKIDLGWRFQDGSVLSLSTLRLFNATKTSGATFAAPGFNVGQTLENSFISAPVFNFPPEFSGPDKITDAAGNPIQGAAVGIWNGASIMTEKFETRTEIWDLTYRLPAFYESETCKMSGWFGGRYFRIHDQFYWATIDINANTGTGGGLNEGDYTAIASNNLWGVDTGLSYEQYLGNGFAVQLDLGAAALLDIVRERAEYTLGLRDTGPEGKKSRSDYTFAPELTGSIALMWYPVQGVQVRLGYNAMAVFNTIGTENPVSFNFAAPDPTFNRIPLRLFDGFDFGVAFIF